MDDSYDPYEDYGVYTDETRTPREKQFLPQPYKHGSYALRPNTSGCNPQGQCYAQSAESLERENFVNSPFDGKLPKMHSNKPLYGNPSLPPRSAMMPAQDVSYRPLLPMPSSMQMAPMQSSMPSMSPMSNMQSVSPVYLDINMVMFIILIIIVVYLVVTVNTIKSQLGDLLRLKMII